VPAKVPAPHAATHGRVVSTHVCESSGREISFVELNGLESMRVAKILESTNLIEMAYYRIGMAMQAIDGHSLPPATSMLLLDERLQRLTANELDELLGAYGRAFNTEAANLKNSLAPTEESPTS